MAGWWQEVCDTVVSELSGLLDTAEATLITFRLLVAAMLGGLLGFEREQRGKAAGVRTHMLVALGAALFVLIPQRAGVPDADLTRVIQGVIVGLGFLGTGAILKGSRADAVKGLTTAAGLWVTAAIGIAVGLGQEASAILGTLLALIILHLLPKFSNGSDRT